MGTRKESCNNPQPPSAQTSYCSTRRVAEAHGSGNKRYPLKSQPRTGHTREPDPTHNELKHTTTRKTATHERTPDKPHVHKGVHTHTHTPPERRTMPINRRHRPASQPHSLSHPHARARSPVEPSPARGLSHLPISVRVQGTPLGSKARLRPRRRLSRARAGCVCDGRGRPASVAA